MYTMEGFGIPLTVVLGLAFVGLISAQQLKFERENVIEFDPKEETNTVALNINDVNIYRDCDDVMRFGGYKAEGVYDVYLNISINPTKVVCRFENGVAYSAIMVRKYGHVNFMRSYVEYQNQFGDLSSDFWSGLQAIKTLTDARNNVLTITLQDWAHTIKTLRYGHFALGPWQSGYPLSIGNYRSSSVLPDDFSHNNGMPFATYDIPDKHGCAQNMKAGWWFNYCTYTLPTGRYYPQGPYTPTSGYYDGMYYADWHGMGYSLKYIKMELSVV